MVNEGIGVVGKGEVKGTPDTVQIQIGVRAMRDTVARATSDGEALGRAVLDALLASGVAGEDIQTRNLSVSQVMDYSHGERPRITGYAFTNTVVAAVRKLDSAGAVIDAALAAGGEDAVLDGVTFLLEDDSAAMVAARAAAYADARSKAEQLAELAGIQLGAAVAIEETLGGFAPGPPVPIMLRAAAAEAAGPAVSAGQVTTTIVVSVRFAIG